MVAADLGQIECRVLNYLAMQDDVVEAFRLHDEGAGPDVYCILAEKIYRKPVVPGDKERLVGKIGELQSGYGSSGRALKKMLFTQAKISMPVHQAQSIIDVYRGSHKQVVNLWDQGDAALGSMLRGQQFSIGRPGMVEGAASGIKLPNGLYLRYPELRQKADDKGRIQFCYTKQNKPVFTHGAVIVQNLCEALSRLILTDAWLRLSKRVRVVLQTHDELVAVVPFAEVDRALEIMVEEMTQPVPWAPGLPLACEAKAGATYGQAKG